MEVIAVIFARGGSKGLPRKNLLPLAGKPLLAWAIEQAKGVARIQRVLVSTDSKEIASVARQYGAETPFLRPPDLATDEAPEWLAWQHALIWLKEKEGNLPRVMVSVPATSPLRRMEDLEAALNEFDRSQADVVIAVTPAHRNPWFNMITINSQGDVQLAVPSGPKFARRQDAPLVYDMTTSVYVLRSAFVLENSSIFEGKVRAVVIPRSRALDIDTLDDFKLAEYLSRNPDIYEN